MLVVFRMSRHAHLYLNELVLPPAGEWEPSIEGWVFARLGSGEGYWMAEKGAMDIGDGRLLVLSLPSGGCVRASQVGPLQLFYFRFCPELLPGVLTLGERQFLRELADRQKGSACLLEGEHPAARAMGVALSQPDSSQGVFSRIRLLEIAMLALGWESGMGQGETTGVIRCESRMQGIINRFTEEEFCELSPAELARQCGCSLQHFKRLFQTCFGTSLRARQNEIRMHRARLMLAETDVPIREVARSAGCRHISYFNTLFKKEFGLTPTEYRRKGARTLARRADKAS